jgi:hypothetical protein
MIQIYIDGLLGKGELIFKKRIRIMEVLSRLHSNFGLLVGVIWILTLYSLFNVSFSFLEPSSVVATWDIVYLILIFGEFLRIQFRLSILSFPLFELLTSTIFSGPIGLFIRIASILSMFYAVFRGGWNVLIHPSQSEQRLLKKRLDWLARWLALVVGVFLALLAIGYDQTILSQLPIDVFKIGIFFGGLIYVILNRRQSIWFLQSVLLLSVSYYCIVIGSFLLKILTRNETNLETVEFLSIIILWTIIIFVFYYGGYPFKRKIFRYSALRYILKANENYQEVWVKDARSRLHRWLFGENFSLTTFYDQRRGYLHLKNKKLYPVTFVTLTLVFIVIPAFLIMLLTALSIKIL